MKFVHEVKNIHTASLHSTLNNRKTDIVSNWLSILAPLKRLHTALRSHSPFSEVQITMTLSRIASQGHFTKLMVRTMKQKEVQPG